MQSYAYVINLCEDYTYEVTLSKKYTHIEATAEAIEKLQIYLDEFSSCQNCAKIKGKETLSENSESTLQKCLIFDYFKIFTNVQAARLSIHETLLMAKRILKVQEFANAKGYFLNCFDQETRKKIYLGIKCFNGICDLVFFDFSNTKKFSEDLTVYSQKDIQATGLFLQNYFKNLIAQSPPFKEIIDNMCFGIYSNITDIFKELNSLLIASRGQLLSKENELRNLQTEKQQEKIRFHKSSSERDQHQDRFKKIQLKTKSSSCPSPRRSSLFPDIKMSGVVRSNIASDGFDPLNDSNLDHLESRVQKLA